MHAAPTVAIDNLLLGALTRRERHRLLAECDEVDLVFPERLCERGERIRHVYFPTGSLISLVAPPDSGPSLEVAAIGNEGMLGTSIALGVDVAPLSALVRSSGSAWRMDAGAFRRAVDASAPLRRVLDRYIYVLSSQLAQMATCMHFHVVEERLARWLLMTRDRAHSNELQVTHEFLAAMLGVRRVGVTRAAGSLQKQKLIRYRRGAVTILDHISLEGASCACYRAEKEVYERVLGTLTQHRTARREAGTPRSAAPRQRHEAGRHHGGHKHESTPSRP